MGVGFYDNLSTSTNQLPFQRRYRGGFHWTTILPPPQPPPSTNPPPNTTTALLTTHGSVDFASAIFQCTVPAASRQGVVPLFSGPMSVTEGHVNHERRGRGNYTSYERDAWRPRVGGLTKEEPMVSTISLHLQAILVRCQGMFLLNMQTRDGILNP